MSIEQGGLTHDVLQSRDRGAGTLGELSPRPKGLMPSDQWVLGRLETVSLVIFHIRPEMCSVHTISIRNAKCALCLCRMH